VKDLRISVSGEGAMAEVFLEKINYGQLQKSLSPYLPYTKIFIA